MASIATEQVGIGMSSRLSRLREKALTMPEICIERALIMTESYKETEGQPAVIRRAKALEKILKEMTIRIDEDELIVGTATSKARGAAILPELQWEWYLDELETLSTRELDRYAPLTEEEKTKLKEFLPYWKGKGIYDRWQAAIPERELNLDHKIQATGGYCENGHHPAHVAINYEKVLSQGLNGVKKQVEEELGKVDLAEMKGYQKYLFLTAANITLAAAMNFAKRYAELAKDKAKRETNSRRKAELERIAEMCAWVPANPARSFYEALQSLWLTWIPLMIEGWGAGLTLGRADQYLYPLYKKDIDDGKLTKEEAIELISLLYIKMNGIVNTESTMWAKYGSGFPIMLGVTLGGVTKDGRDAVNELSYLFLEADKYLGLTQEDLVIRIHKTTPDAFVIKACEVAKQLRGKLKFVGDETNIQGLLTEGKPIEYARDYVSTGCHTVMVPGYSHDIGGVTFNIPLMLELALNNGATRLTGEQIGPKTGDPRKFKSYEEVWEAYKKQLDALISVVCLYKNVEQQLYAELAPYPLQSALFNECIEKGLDINNGGTAPYMSHITAFTGMPNVGDSLAAIKKAVFDDKKISIEQLIDALDKNFEGEEQLLNILRSAPKFGNDDDYVDSIMIEVNKHAAETVNKHKIFLGAKNVTSAQGMTANMPLGQIVGALPDGRKAGEPLSEGGISPYQGRNVSGPTATLRSIAKLDHAKMSHGSVLNMRFSPDALKDEQKMRKFAAMIRTFFETGGSLVQFNIVDADTLRAAQKHPEKYRDLIVRVATYSAYFVELCKENQDDIIARTEFQEV